MKTLFGFIALLNVLSIVSQAQAPDNFSFKGNYKITTPGTISVTTNDGFINVSSTEANEIEVYYIVKKDNRVVDMDLEELKSHLNVSIENSTNHFELIITQKESDWVKNWKDRYTVSLQINAPRQSACTLKTSDGDIMLKNFQGGQYCKTSDGNITIDNLTGDLVAQTSDGNINIANIQGTSELVTSDGQINAEHIQGNLTGKTSDGDIFFNDLRGENFAKTSDGNISFEAMKGSLNAQTSDGDIRGTITQLSNSLYLKTSDGNISVTIPKSLGLDLLLKGERIDTKLEDFSGDAREHSIEGKIRGGGVRVELTTSDGTISLNYQ
jgi:DUF4097 and DUF4098 domain-containing protein YvlB